MWQSIIEFQRDIYLAFADHIKAFANGGATSTFLAFLPMGIAFGAVHALTPGHSKALLATYLAGTPSGVWRGLGTAFAISVTHVCMSVLIVLFSIPLVNIMLGGDGPGSSPFLMHLSRGLLGFVGLWMIWRGCFGRPHTHAQREGFAVGVIAGLIPCPLTLFVMTFSVMQGVPEAGIMFAMVMLVGVAMTLGTVAMAAVWFRRMIAFALEDRSVSLIKVSRFLEAVSGSLLLAFAFAAMLPA